VTDVVLLGGGGHARVVADVAGLLGWHVVGIVAPVAPAATDWADCPPWLGGDDVLPHLDVRGVSLINAVGGGSDALVRRRIFVDAKRHGLTFATICHPSATIGAATVLGEACQVMAGAIIQPGTSLGANVLVNTAASIDHDNCIGDHAIVAPRAVLGGGVDVGENAFIGMGAVVLPNLRVGQGALVAAGAVVTRDVAAGTRVFGCPARTRA
jgi:UDP-perosamine 4-acetyltransferase